MSESEKKKRARYRQRRRIALTLLAVLLVAVTLVTAAFGVALYRINRTIYIDYTESGKVDYTVALKPNDFYDATTLPAGQSYVASLIDGVVASFDYVLKTEAADVSYEYTYWLDTRLLITDKSTGAAIYNPTFPVKEKETLTQKDGSTLKISESVTVDYAHYNDIAERFIEVYELSNVESHLVARMHVSVLSLCEEFREDEVNEYVITLNIPLTGKTVNVEMSSTVPNTESKILACEQKVDTALFVTVITAGGIADILLLITLLLVALLTRNKDITYAIKVKKLLSAYRSFIQEIKNPFATDGYQVLAVASFNEMLEIRDTVNAPILMHENEDKTCTQFVIPTGIGLVYLYELKVADYDELYANIPCRPVVEEVTEEAAEEAAEEVTEETTEEAAEEVTEEIVEEAAEEAAEEVTEEVVEEAAEEVTAETTEEDAEEVTEETAGADALIFEATIAADDLTEDAGAGFSYGPKYDYSFAARLALADDDAKRYWRTIVTFARSFGVKVSRSWGRDRIYFGRSLFAVITFKGKKLAVAFAMDPTTADPKYHAVDLSAYKKFERTPMLMRISSQRKVKFATDLLRELFTAGGLQDKKLTVKVEEVAPLTKEELLATGMIRPKKN